MRGQSLAFLLTPGLIAAAVLAALGVMAWAARRGEPRPGPGSHTFLFRYNGVFRGFAYFAAFVIPVGLTVLVIAFPPRRNEVWYVLGVYALLAGLSLPLVWEAARYYLLVSPAGLERRSPWRGVEFVPWQDVREVGYSPVNAWFIVRGRSGRPVRVSVFVSGIGELLRLVELRVPPAALEPARAGYQRVGRPFPEATDQPVLEARPPRRRGEW